MSPEATHESSLGLPLGLLVAAALVALNAFYVGAEFSLVRARPSRIKALARTGSRSAILADRLVSNLDETLSVCQVGITLASLALGWIGEPVFAAMMRRVLGPLDPWLGSLSITVSIATAFLIITFLHIVLGELVPKSIGIAMAERAALWIAIPLRVSQLALYPLVAVLNFCAQLFLRPFKLDSSQAHADPSEDEIKQSILRSRERGAIGPVQARLLEGILPFSRRRSRDVMVPLARVALVDLRQPWPAIVQLIINERYSRYPLFDGDYDRIARVIHTKTLLPFLADSSTAPDLMKLSQPAPVIPDTLSLERLLAALQTAHAHMAIVANEYGHTVGIVTIEDVLEELVGELRDEFDQEEVDPVRSRPGGGYLLDPVLPIDRALELIGESFELPDGVHTLSGLLQAELGRIPRRGDSVPFGDKHRLEASAVQGTRVLEVALIPIPSGSVSSS
jgi:CBS domain containing-hemolysin-like protein